MKVNRAGISGWLILGGVLAGCWSPPAALPDAKDKASPQVAVAPAADGHGHDEKRPPAPPLLKGWESPAAVLVFSGDQHGYIEPCGCALHQLGGLSRRADLFKQLRAKQWPVIALDNGGLVNRPKRTQARAKFHAMTEGLRKLGYNGMAIGKEEVELGAGEIIALPVEDELLISCNVIILDDPDIGRKRFKMFKAGDKKIGVTAILGNSLTDEIFGVGGKADEFFKVVDPADALKKVLAEMEAEKPDLLVLLSHAKSAESKELAAAFPQFQIVVTSYGPEDPSLTPEKVGDALFVSPGGKGKHVAIVGYFPEAPKTLKFELVDIDDQRFQLTAAIEDIMARYQEELKTSQLAVTEKATPHPADATFMGAKVCGECHTKSYAKWSTTKHARALESLAKGHEGQKGWIDRTSDPECLACHVTGWAPQKVFPFTGGYLHEVMQKDRKGKEFKPELAGQQCENCHGPGSVHAAEEYAFRKTSKITPVLTQQRKAMHLDTEVAKKSLCVQCHDGDNSPKYDFDKYWEQVRHPGRD